VFNLRGQTISCNAYFFLMDGTKLKDFNQRFFSNDGQVSVGERATPLYDNTHFSDFQLFIPYDELHMSAGQTHQLKFYTEIFIGNTSLIKSSEVNFSVTVP